MAISRKTKSRQLSSAEKTALRRVYEGGASDGPVRFDVDDDTYYDLDDMGLIRIAANGAYITSTGKTMAKKLGFAKRPRRNPSTRKWLVGRVPRATLAKIPDVTAIKRVRPGVYEFRTPADIDVVFWLGELGVAPEDPDSPPAIVYDDEREYAESIHVAEDGNVYTAPSLDQEIDWLFSSRNPGTFVLESVPCPPQGVRGPKPKLKVSKESLRRAIMEYDGVAKLAEIVSVVAPSIELGSGGAYNSRRCFARHFDLDDFERRLGQVAVEDPDGLWTLRHTPRVRNLARRCANP